MITTFDRSDQISQRVVLEGISWTTYQMMLSELGDHRASRLAYDQGTLEITMPSEIHEIVNRLLDRMVIALTEELDLKMKAYGSTTLDREDLAQGVEPDSCYYIQNVEQIRVRKLDLTTVPPPDLAIEVDITRSSRRRLGIYLQLQIPEVWCYTQANGVTIYQLRSGQYVQTQNSLAFPIVSDTVLTQFLQLAETADP
jgi:Uma2 family endonuclease